jgi:hypothetical protein
MTGPMSVHGRNNVHAGHKVLMEVDKNGAPGAFNLQGILDQLLRPSLIHLLDMIYNIILLID